MISKINTIFIGAGPAALAAANKLLDLDHKDFLILEKGNKLIKRTCPGEKNNTCKFCKEGCYTVEGIGGSNALHGNKICYFPASSAILDECNDFERNSTISYLNNFSPYIDNGNIEKYKDNKDDHLKYYTSDVLNKKEYKNLIELLSKRLADNELLRTNIEITNVDRIGPDKFLLKTTENDEYLCNNLIFATGRSSYTFKEVFDNLHIQYSTLNQDIGIRIESGKENFSDSYYYQVDPKIKFQYDGIGSARTFCAHNQGLVVPVQFGNCFFADGAFDERFSDKNNIALMVRSNAPISNAKIEEWCRKINELSNKSLILKEVNISNLTGLQLAKEIFKALPFFPTVEHATLMEKFLEDLFCNERYNILRTNIENQKLTIYGPAIDRYWITPAIDDKFQTIGVDNCFVIGDALGISRGIFQAMFSGVLWVQKFLTNKAKCDNHDKIWSSRLSSSF